MIITAMSLTNGTLTVIVDGGTQILTARNDNPRWSEILDAFKSQNHTRILSLLSLKSIVEEYTRGSLSVNSTGVTFGGQPIHTVDANRVMAFLRDGLPYQPIANYMARCRKNQSARAIAELYSFLEHRNMPLTEEGFIIAYKGVRSTFYSVMGNTKTVVLQGVTDTEGHILNTVGTTIEIERSSCDDDFRNGCSFGLHAGSLAYARGWGQRVVLVEIDPADVVSVPEDCSCQKLRCCKYRVIGEYTGPMPDTYTAEFGNRDDTNPADDDGEDTCNCGSYDCVECNPDSDPSDEDTYAGCGDYENECACKVAEAQGQAVNQNGNGDDYETEYLEGIEAGILDLGAGTPKYLPGDETGADSPAHASQIIGYLHGYFGIQS